MFTFYNRNCIILILVFGVLVDLGSSEEKVLLRKEIGKYLNKSLIRVLHASNEFECGAICSKEPSCVSVNYKVSGEDWKRCEINNKSIEEAPERDRLKNCEFIYLELVKQQCKRKSPNTPDELYSSLILNHDGYKEQLKTWLKHDSNWKLCYRASQHDWSASHFHSQCDNKGPTVTIVRVGDYIFGGYSSASWGGTGYKACVNCFLFSLKNKDNIPPFQAPVYPDKTGHAVYNLPKYGPSFGKSFFDLRISQGGSLKCFSSLGTSYKPPQGYQFGSAEVKALLAGSQTFDLNEVEVYYLNN